MDILPVGGRGGSRRSGTGVLGGSSRYDKSVICVRINLFLDIFRPIRGSGLPALIDVMHAATSAEPDASV